jgi:hypothetical protein
MAPSAAMMAVVFISTGGESSGVVFYKDGDDEESRIWRGLKWDPVVVLTLATRYHFCTH